jgi:glycosyltransferase involved in cell wall biosynthesis
MSARWHLLTGEYAPAIGGIARFTRTLAEALAGRGDEVHVWVPGGGADAPGITIHALVDRFGRRGRRQLETGIRPGDIVLLQYAPNALGSRGANLAFCVWLVRAARRWNIRVVFHEPFFYLARQPLARNLLALVQRLMAAVLLSGARRVYLSSSSWQRLLQPYSFGRVAEWRALPISVGVVSAPSAEQVRAVRAQYARADRPLIGHFGSYAGELVPHLRSAIGAVLGQRRDAQMLCMGQGSTAFVAEYFAGESRVTATGTLADADIPAHLCACDLLVAPFREGVTARRTSLMSALALGRPLVTTEGIHTEPEWRSDDAVALVPAGQAAELGAACRRLLEDESGRARLAARAAEMYQRRYSPQALLAALGAETPTGVVVGTHMYGALAEAGRRQAAAAASLAALRCQRRVAIVFPDDGCPAGADGLERQAVLRRDSAEMARARAPRRAVTREVFDALAALAREAGARYFFFVNGDIRLSQAAVDLITSGGSTAYVFTRTDIDADGGNAALLLSGIDGFAVDVNWYAANAWRFREYLIGDRTWDNVYASILFSHGDARMVYRSGWLLHERHSSRWLNGPYSSYLRYLSALDAQYFRLWCEFHDRGCEAVERGGGEDALNAIAHRVFVWRPTAADRLVQHARGWKAAARFALARRQVVAGP